MLWTAQIWSRCFKDKDFSDTVCLISDFLASGFNPSKAGFWSKLRRAGMIGFVRRGPYNAVADDSELKFREMARAHALGYSAAEFLHGPVGAYTAKDFVFLFSPTTCVGAATRHGAPQAASRGLPDDIEKVRLALNDRKTPYCVIAPVKGKFPFNCMLADIEMKLIALHLALAKGLNPDNPKGLNKVTQTF